jgi:hypothetical protein
MDARVYDFNNAYETLEKGAISERIVYSLERRVIRPDFDK